MGRSADNALNPITKAFRVESWIIDSIKNSEDYNRKIFWLDQWTTDERIDYIIHSSSKWSVTESFVYDWSAWNYYIIEINISKTQ